MWQRTLFKDRRALSGPGASRYWLRRQSGSGEFPIPARAA
jgi:hypothetical protein